MKLQGIDRNLGARNRNQVIVEILRRPGLSRTDIGRAVGLNVASVSRITRDLIDAGLVRETDAFGPKGRPGRRFVGLRPADDGGHVIGIGLNAFRQSVTLADLRNRKIAEWVFEGTPGENGEDFIRLCLEKAKDMVREHVADPGRFFGVGMAVAAELDKGEGRILNAPVFGWHRPIAAADLAREVLGAALALDTPASAINSAEAERGLGRDVTKLTTLHCTLRFGIGVHNSGTGGCPELKIGRAMTQSKAPDGSGRTLSEACGGLAILEAVLGADALAGHCDAALSAMLVEVIGRAARDPEIRAVLRENGARTARYLALVLDLCAPERLLLAGPLAEAEDYVAGFRQALPMSLSRHDRAPEIHCSDMTPTGASRWLALYENVAMGNLDLAALKQETAA